MSVYGAEMGAVLITGVVVYGVSFLASLVVTLWWNSMDQRIQEGDNSATQCMKKIAVARRVMLGLASAALLFVTLAYLLTLFRVGNATRDDGITVNYGYFAVLSVAWFLLALVHSVYFWFEGNVNRLVLGLIWAAAFAMLAVAPLFHPHVKRELVFGLSVALQGGSLLVILWAEGINGPLMRWRGWLAAFFVVAAFVLYDTFWFIGYLNEGSRSVIVHTPWKSQLPFLFADASAFIGSVLVALWFYKPKRYEPVVAVRTVEADMPSAYAPVQDAGY